MTQFGTGVGTPTGGGTATAGGGGSSCGVSLVRYAEIIGYRECAFFGIYTDDDDSFECRRVWTKSQRDMIQHALLEAQEELEREIGYFLCPKWTTAERHTVKKGLTFQTAWAKVIAGGVVSDTTLQAGLAPNYATDPATIGPVNLGTCDVDNVYLFHTGTDIAIEPESVTVVGVNATFSVPWCRLVAPAFMDNPTGGWEYSDVATWGTHSVDARCIANDESTQAELIWRDTANCDACGDTRQDGCIYVRREDIGHVDVRPGTYSGGAWSGSALCRPRPDMVEVNYLSGLQTMTRQAEDAIVRLAHAKMAEEPCGCEVTQRLWQRDRNMPTVLTAERLNCPFGLNDGAWIAYRFAKAMRVAHTRIL